MYKLIIKLRSQLLVYLTHRMALPVLKVIRKPAVFPFTKEELKNFGDGTLGKDLIDFLETKQLRRVMLATKDAHTLYEQFGFSAIPDPTKLMGIKFFDEY